MKSYIIVTTGSDLKRDVKTNPMTKENAEAWQQYFKEQYPQWNHKVVRVEDDK